MSDRNDYRPEPEIIPPGADPLRRPDPGDPRQQRERVWVWSNDPRYGRLRPGGPGGLGLVLVIAVLAGLGALGFFVFLGALAIALPLIAAVIVAGLLANLLRRL